MGKLFFCKFKYCRAEWRIQCALSGVVKFKEPLKEIRQKVLDLQQNGFVVTLILMKCPVSRKIVKGGYYFHATDDVPEVRKVFYDYIKTINCSFEAVVGRKIMGIYINKHNGKESEFYADLLSHLIKTNWIKEEIDFGCREQGKQQLRTITRNLPYKRRLPGTPKR